MANKVYITTPTGRLVSGSVYQGSVTDMDGQPLVFKSGANKGQPKTNYYIGVAIQKTQGLDWTQEPWGIEIMKVAKTVTHAFNAQTGQLNPNRSFAFKVVDGDSDAPNQNNHKPCDAEGYQGNWILNFTNFIAPKVCNAEGTQYFAEPNLVKRGYFIQVYASIGANDDMRNPGVYLNQEICSFQGVGEEIFSGADMSQAGFGGNAIPQGMTTIPQGMTPATGTPGAPIAGQQTAPPSPPAQQTAPPSPPAQQTAPPSPPAQQTAPPPPPPATDLVQQQEQLYKYNGNQYTEAQLLKFPGWTKEHVANLELVDDIPF